MPRFVKLRVQIGTSMIGALVAVVMALGLSGLVAVPASASQGDDVGLQGCLAMFPNGVPGTEAATAAIIQAGLDPAEVDDIFEHANGGAVSCYDIFGVQPPVEPTKVPVEPTKVPVEPTKVPVEPTKVPVEPTKAPVEPTKAVGGKAEPTVAAMPATGSGPASSDGIPAVGILAALATILAAVAGITLRMTAVRAPRR